MQFMKDIPAVVNLQKPCTVCGVRPSRSIHCKRRMISDLINEIGIDEERRIYLQPHQTNFPQIYREGIDLHWEPLTRRLRSSVPRDWSYLQWFQHLVTGSGVDFTLSPSVTFTAVPDDLRELIVSWMASRGAE
jgi:hypothetical protein